MNARTGASDLARLMSMARSNSAPMLLGEWACLGVLYNAPAHGFAVAARLKPEGDVGRVWTVSRALTYRAIDELVAAGYVEEMLTERGVAGGNRTVYRATRSGRAALRAWLHTPVEHLRDMRSELLLKLVLADSCAVDIADMLREQHRQVALMVTSLSQRAKDRDVIAMWRLESAKAAQAFLELVIAERSSS